jgi:hypothetical protein
MEINTSTPITISDPATAGEVSIEVVVEVIVDTTIRPLNQGFLR